MSNAQSSAAVPELQGEREIVISRRFAAPRQLVWDAFTQPEHADKWWGPTGFRNVTSEHNLRVGGTWRHMMIGPDGTEYPNRKTYHIIDPPARLAYSHGWDRDGGELFEAEVIFEEDGDGTLLTMRSTFPTAAARDEVVEKFGAVEGGKQTLARLDDYLRQLAAPSNA
jgi:uncharacterized protein YndB with AHSA1/START domain